jgi:LPS sulfotransferase NodH
LRAGQEPGQPTPDVELIMQLVQFAQRSEDGWRQWFASRGIQPCQVVYEDLVRDRLAAANAALESLRLPQLDTDDLPPVRYRKQADTLTERCARRLAPWCARSRDGYKSRLDLTRCKRMSTRRER